MKNQEMMLGEIETYKKAHANLSENLKDMNKQCNQYKAERDKFENMLNKECECGFQMEGKYHDMKAERDTLIDDLSWYKAKVNRLEDNIKTLERKNADVRTLNWELKGYADMYKGEWQKHKALNTEFSQHIGRKPSSSTYKYFRAKLYGIGIKEGE